jgi:hypothetical protein
MLVTGDEIHFPIASGSHMDWQERELPPDIGRDFNLVKSAFRQPQQAVISTWTAFVQEVAPAFIFT